MFGPFSTKKLDWIFLKELIPLYIHISLGLSQLAKLVSIDVGEIGVGGAKDFFQAKIHMANRSNKFEEEVRLSLQSFADFNSLVGQIKQEQQEKKKELEEKKKRQEEFKNKQANFVWALRDAQLGSRHSNSSCQLISILRSSGYQLFGT